jgi:hypothetical protein
MKPTQDPIAIVVKISPDQALRRAVGDIHAHAHSAGTWLHTQRKVSGHVVGPKADTTSTHPCSRCAWTMLHRAPPCPFHTAALTPISLCSLPKFIRLPGSSPSNLLLNPARSRPHTVRRTSPACQDSDRHSLKADWVFTVFTALVLF